MGVPRGFYAVFAHYLATKGARVLTLDYRGIGKSEHVPGASLADWGELDLPAGVDTLYASAPELPIHFIGHSVGGQLFGLFGDDRIKSATFVASQSGYWRHWDGVWRLRILALWFGLVPTTTKLFGHLPATLLGGGDNIPGGVAAQWARWGRHPDYIYSYANTLTKSGFNSYTGPIRALAFRDDSMAPERAARSLLSYFDQTTPEFISIRPEDAQLSSIGHFGAFRPAAKGLWEEMTPR